MPGFYDRGPVDAVGPYVDALGQTHPLDVVPYGGTLIVHAAVASLTSVALLGVPAAGTVYRLHNFASPFTAAGTNPVTLNDPASGAIFGCITPAVQSFQLGGQITGTALQATNDTANAQTVWLTYDIVISTDIT